MADVEIQSQTTANGGTSSSLRTHSRESSESSEWWKESDDLEEDQNKENDYTNVVVTGSGRRASSEECSDDSSGKDDSGKLVLRDGGKLVEESGTEVTGFSNPGFRSSNGSSGADNEETRNGHAPPAILPDIPPRQPSSSSSSSSSSCTGGGTGTARQRALKSGNIVYSIPEEEITIPNDGNLASFSADAMATFLRYLRLEDRLVSHLHRNGLDGRKFGRLKDSDLANLKLVNPVVVFFRDRTAPAVTKKSKPRLPFVL